ncbi:hypothetical protein [Longispora albida]|uniref:hypothetical protein n=1 Tax=Longispora albida TaxID=203523 RepID=UPI000377E1CE|nr:hypothetical protein [Longispora albida]
MPKTVRLACLLLVLIAINSAPALIASTGDLIDVWGKPTPGAEDTIPRHVDGAGWTEVSARPVYYFALAVALMSTVFAVVFTIVSPLLALAMSRGFQRARQAALWFAPAGIVAGVAGMTTEEAATPWAWTIVLVCSTGVIVLLTREPSREFFLSRRVPVDNRWDLSQLKRS